MNSNPHSHTPKSSGKPCQKSGPIIAKGTYGLHMGVRVRRSQTFVLIVYIFTYCNQRPMTLQGHTHYNICIFKFGCRAKRSSKGRAELLYLWLGILMSCHIDFRLSGTLRWRSLLIWFVILSTEKTLTVRERVTFYKHVESAVNIHLPVTCAVDLYIYKKTNKQTEEMQIIEKNEQTTWYLADELPCRAFNSFSLAIISSSLARILLSISSFSAWIFTSFVAKGFCKYSSLCCWNIFL